MVFENLYGIAEEYLNFSCRPKNPKYKVGHVINENKSVKWNREEVERLNKKHEDEVKELNRQKNLLHTNLVNSIKEYIISETNVSKERAEKIYNYLYQEYCSYGLKESLTHLDDLLELFK